MDGYRGGEMNKRDKASRVKCKLQNLGAESVGVGCKILSISLYVCKFS